MVRTFSGFDFQRFSFLKLIISLLLIFRTRVCFSLFHPILMKGARGARVVEKGRSNTEERKHILRFVRLKEKLNILRFRPARSAGVETLCGLNIRICPSVCAWSCTPKTFSKLTTFLRKSHLQNRTFQNSDGRF